MFRVKICGITSVDDALLAARLGADALGLNFYPRSSRYLPVELASLIAREVRKAFAQNAPKLVGVFVNEAKPQLHEIAKEVGLDAWQLHGDEPAELVATLKTDGPQQVIRAFRCREANLSAIAQQLNDCQTAGASPDAVLLDAYAPDAYGGTGQVVDWNAVRKQRQQLCGLPIILAGGLTPENIAQAIRSARPDAIDVASGVESSPGKKDAAKLQDFIDAAKAAFKTGR